MRKITENLRDFAISLNEREFRLYRDDLISLLKTSFVIKFNEDNDKFKSKFENFEKKKSSLKKKEIKNNNNDNNNI